MTSENGKVILKYSTNEVCPTNSSAFISTSIVFSCSSSDQQLVSPINRSSTSFSTSHIIQNSPEFVEVSSDCVHIFNWPSTLVCKPGQKPSKAPTSQCIYEDKDRQIFVDFKKMSNLTVSGHRVAVKINSNSHWRSKMRLGLSSSIHVGMSHLIPLMDVQDLPFV